MAARELVAGAAASGNSETGIGHPEKRVRGLEPLTFSLEGCKPELQGAETQPLAGDTPAAYIPTYTPAPDSLHDAPPAGDDFATAVLVIQGLPLSDDEKAEAIRRLLGKAGT